MSEQTVGRRLIVTQDGSGFSSVARDGYSEARIVRPNGAVSVEIWRQESIPARSGEDGTREGPMAPMPPPGGACYRVFTLAPRTQPETEAQTQTVAAAFGGPQNLFLTERGILLHRTDSLYVLTVVSGHAYLVLADGEVLLGPGDSVVLPGVMHTWSNPFDAPTVMVCAVFPYVPD